MIGVVLVAGFGIWVGSLAWRSSERIVVSEVAKMAGERSEVVLPIDAGRAFPNAETMEERLKWTRRGERVWPLMGGEAVAPEVVGLPIKVSALTFMGQVLAGKMQFTNFHVVMAGGGSRLLAVVETKAGPGVDWECFARYQPVSWEKILSEGTGGKAVPVRAFVQASDYYNFEYADEKKWSCYEINTPDLESRRFAYADRCGRDGGFERVSGGRCGDSAGEVEGLAGGDGGANAASQSGV
jgi:hypothetical protein